MPAGLWEADTFDLIGNSFGRVVAQSKASLLDEVMVMEKVGILTKSMASIDESLFVKRGDKTVRIHVVEEVVTWSPVFKELRASPEDDLSEKSQGPSIEKTNSCCMGNPVHVHRDGGSGPKLDLQQNIGGTRGSNNNSRLFSVGQDSYEGPKSKKRRRSSGGPFRSVGGSKQSILDIGLSKEACGLSGNGAANLSPDFNSCGGVTAVGRSEKNYEGSESLGAMGPME